MINRVDTPNDAAVYDRLEEKLAAKMSWTGTALDYVCIGIYPADWVCLRRKAWRHRLGNAEIKGYIWGCATIAFIWMITWWLQR